jgi:hypothetical protein
MDLCQAVAVLSVPKPMTAFAVSAIPSSINSLERLIVWCGQAMQNAQNGQTVNVVAGEQQQPYASVSTSVLANGDTHFIVNAYVPFDLNDLNSPTQKTWMAAKDVVSAQPATNFLAN